MNKVAKRNPWAWIPTLYFAQGIPYFAVNMISVMMFKRLGMSNTDIALYTGWLYLPWVIKPFWSPIVDVLKTKRWWTVVMQLLVTIALAGVAFTIPTPSAVNFELGNTPVSLFSFCLAIFWIMAFASATHDIASDGFYMLALNTNEQSLFVGIRSTFYRCASILGQGGLVALAGILETSMNDIPKAWVTTFACMAVFFWLVSIYHLFILPYPASDKPTADAKNGGVGAVIKSFGDSFATFFTKKNVLIAILFMLLYRLPEAQLIKLIQPFLVDSFKVGGLGLTTAQVGIAYGTIGVIGLTLGGIIGGICASRGGLKKWLWPMALCISLNSIVYILLSYFQPDVNTPLGTLSIWACVFIDQFGYGFGFTAFMLFMMYFADGPYKTSHYAICTAFMALGMMLPGMIAGWVQSKLGYTGFFCYVLCCTFATWAVTALVYPRIDPSYGVKHSEPKEDDAIKG